MTSKYKMFAATAALGLALATPAFADPIALESSVNGNLSATDQRNEDRQAYMDTYQINLPEGQAVDVRLSSEEFDTYLSLGIQNGTSYEEYASNDDSGGTLNSRIRFTAPAAGTYTIQASSFGSDTMGSYNLAVSPTVIVPPPVPRALTLGQSLSGSVSPSGPTREDTGQPYDLFTFEANAGQIVVFTMNSPDFDSYLEVGQNMEWGFEPLYSDDDSGGDLNSRMVYRFTDAGTYTLRAMGLSESSTGNFTVAAEAYPQPAEPRPTTLRMNRIMRGALEEGEVVNANMQFYDVYSIRVREGQEVRISMRSDTLDSYLEAGMLTPAGWAVAASDDDSGGGNTGLDAQLNFTAQTSGTLIVRAMGLSAMTTGEYSISVE